MDLVTILPTHFIPNVGHCCYVKINRLGVVRVVLHTVSLHSSVLPPESLKPSDGLTIIARKMNISQNITPIIAFKITNYLLITLLHW